MVALNARFRMYVDRPGVMRRLDRWQQGLLGRTGAYGRGVMTKQIRPISVSKKARTVDVPHSLGMRGVRGGTVLVPVRGKVVAAGTNRPVDRNTAFLARQLLYRRQAQESKARAGKPPRSRTGKLRRNIDFGVDPRTDSVVIGAWPFPQQPVLVGAVSVPELLNKGGGEVINGTLAKYDPFPFVETVLNVTSRKMAEFIRQRPVHSV